MRRPTTASTNALLLSLWLASAACGVLDPRLPAVPPPPAIAPGLVLLELPEGVVDELAQESVREHREAELPGLQATNPERTRRMLARQVTVGMTYQDVIWTFLAHPTRVRDQGPPGGHTLLWEPGRYFVRFDAAGLAAAAGRY